MNDFRNHVLAADRRAPHLVQLRKIGPRQNASVLGESEPASARVEWISPPDAPTIASVCRLAH